MAERENLNELKRRVAERQAMLRSHAAPRQRFWDPLSLPEQYRLQLRLLAMWLLALAAPVIYLVVR